MLTDSQISGNDLVLKATDRSHKIIQQLLSPEAYPHPVNLPIRLEQTHISYILLTGEWAYKIKKPLDLGFLDFRTLESRKYFCEQELSRNRHFAPELYSAVLPLVLESSGKIRLGKYGEEVLEYALQMREFPQESLFRAMFESGVLELFHLQDLGRRLADWHLTAATNPEVQAYGSVEATRVVVEDNFQATQPYIGSLQTPEQFKQTQNFQLNFLNQQSGRFQKRQTEGWVRECHGDLHLNNVCWFSDQSLPFDCIEFNQEFRCIDVIYDVAFMVMDLEYRGRSDLAYGFFNTWMEQTGDYEGAAMLSFYAGLRAYVRAKVKSFLCFDTHLAPEKQDLLRKETAKFYHLAGEYSRPRKSSCWVVYGVSGSGKSTVAAWSAQQIGAVHIRSDAVRKHLSGIALEQRGDDALYSPEQTERTYSRMLELAADLTAQGISVVLDATYAQKEQRNRLRAWAETQNIPLNFVHCTAPEAVLVERLQTRKNDVSDATAELLPQLLQNFEPLTLDEQLPLIGLDTTDDWRKILRSCFKKL